jgi:hypothetical protein
VTTVELPYYGDTERHRQVVPRARRSVTEHRDDQGAIVLHIVETGVPLLALRDFAETAALVAPVGPAGTTGAWTLTPSDWRLSVVAAVGDILEWAPNVHLGGGPAALDLASVVDGSPARWHSSGSTTPLDLGSVYVQGDYGTVRLPTLRWTVRSADVSAGRVVLALGYRAGSGGDTMMLGHAGIASRIGLVNHGPVDRT